MAKAKIKSGYNFDRGEHTTVTASDTVQTGLTDVLFAFATLESDPIAAADQVTVVPAASGQITIKTWKPTATADTAPVAATTFSRVVNWFAIGR